MSNDVKDMNKIDNAKKQTYFRIFSVIEAPVYNGNLMVLCINQFDVLINTY